MQGMKKAGSPPEPVGGPPVSARRGGWGWGRSLGKNAWARPARPGEGTWGAPLGADVRHGGSPRLSSCATARTAKTSGGTHEPASRSRSGQVPSRHFAYKILKELG